MSDAIIVALITGACAIIAQMIISKMSSKELYDKLDKQSELADKELDSKIQKWQAVTDTKLDELTREVRRHNDFAERIPVMEEKISVANHRIEDLEKSRG